jgi:hypothetical protein
MSENSVTKKDVLVGIRASRERLEKAVVDLYMRQTSGEQQLMMSLHNNQRGFSMVNAPFMSSLAKQILAGRNLTDKQAAAAMRTIRRYGRQLVEIESGTA